VWEPYAVHVGHEVVAATVATPPHASTMDEHSDSLVAAVARAGKAKLLGHATRDDLPPRVAELKARATRAWSRANRAFGRYRALVGRHTHAKAAGAGVAPAYLTRLVGSAHVEVRRAKARAYKASEVAEATEGKARGQRILSLLGRMGGYSRNEILAWRHFQQLFGDTYRTSRVRIPVDSAVRPDGSVVTGGRQRARRFVTRLRLRGQQRQLTTHGTTGRRLTIWNVRLKPSNTTTDPRSTYPSPTKR
jgi:hypothetical protein